MKSLSAFALVASFVAGAASAAPPSQTRAVSSDPIRKLPSEETPELSGGRLVGELFAGLGSGAAGLLVGGLGGLGFAEATACGDPFCTLDYAAIGGAVGYAATVPLGVYLAGRAGDETGSLGWTYAGSLVASLAGVALLSVRNEWTTGVAAATPIVGAMIGFNATRRYEPSRRARTQTWVPTASVAGERSTFGIVGTF